MINSSVNKALNDWYNLTYPKDKTIYKRELLIEKNHSYKYLGGAITLPLARQVAATTIGFDLVSVSPIERPSGQLFYVDYNVDYNLENKNLYKKVLLIEKYIRKLKKRTRRSRRRGQNGKKIYR
jgi:hypothetical protein